MDLMRSSLCVGDSSAMRSDSSDVQCSLCLFEGKIDGWQDWMSSRCEDFGHKIMK